MVTNLAQLLENNTDELEKYIRQIKSYEAQAETIELSSLAEDEIKNSRPEWVLVLWTGIAGIRFHVDMTKKSGQRIMESLIPGVELKLVREPDNKYDRWAIAIYTQKDEMLGYLTRYKNETIARLMDQGYRFHAIIENELQTNYQVPNEQRAITENYQVPFSVWME